MAQWPHAPAHKFDKAGTFMVTGATAGKEHFFGSRAKLQILHDTLLEQAVGHGWLLQAWAVFVNHYHFIAISPGDPAGLPALIKGLHGVSSKLANTEDGTPGRRVWFQYWDSRITFQNSYFARLNYVHNNPVRHGLVKDAASYKWCSAGWFDTTADESLVKTVRGYKTDRVNVPDDF